MALKERLLLAGISHIDDIIHAVAAWVGKATIHPSIEVGAYDPGITSLNKRLNAMGLQEME